MAKKDPILILGVSNYVYSVAIEVEKLLQELNPKDNINKYELHIFTEEKQNLEIDYSYVIHLDTSFNYFEARMLEIAPPIIFFCDPAEYLYKFDAIKEIVDFNNQTFTFDLKVHKLEDATDVTNNKSFFKKDINNYEITSIVSKIDELIYLEHKEKLYKLNLIITKNYRSSKIIKVPESIKKSDYIINNICYNFSFNFFTEKISQCIYKHFNSFIDILEKDVQNNKFPESKKIHLNFLKLKIDKKDIKSFVLMFKEIYLKLAKSNYEIYVLIEHNYGELLKKYFNKIKLCDFSFQFTAVDKEENINLIDVKGIITEKNHQNVQNKIEEQLLFFLKKSSVKPVIYFNLADVELLDKTIFIVIKKCIQIYQNVHKLSTVPIIIIVPTELKDEFKKSFSIFKIDVIDKQGFEEKKAELIIKKLKF